MELYIATVVSGISNLGQRLNFLPLTQETTLRSPSSSLLHLLCVHTVAPKGAMAAGFSLTPCLSGPGEGGVHWLLPVRGAV